MYKFVQIFKPSNEIAATNEIMLENRSLQPYHHHAHTHTNTHIHLNITFVSIFCSIPINLMHSMRWLCSLLKFHNSVHKMFSFGIIVCIILRATGYFATWESVWMQWDACFFSLFCMCVVPSPPLYYYVCHKLTEIVLKLNEKLCAPLFSCANEVKLFFFVFFFGFGLVRFCLVCLLLFI